MTTFEALVLVFYMSFAFGYMVNTLGVNETDSFWLRVATVFVALTLGVFWFPIVFGIDVYNKLNDYGKRE